MASTGCDGRPHLPLTHASQAISAISLLVLAVPLVVIAIYQDVKFARERFVLATLVAAMLLNIYLALESFHVRGADALSQTSSQHTLDNVHWCGYLGFEVFTQWLVQFELTLVIYYTFYSVQTLSKFPLRSEVQPLSNSNSSILSALPSPASSLCHPEHNRALFVGVPPRGVLHHCLGFGCGL